MKKFFAILCAVSALALAAPSFAHEGNDNENPCGNHGNNCCTDDGGETYTSVESTCSSFCESTATAVSVAVSECESKAAATCSQTCGEQLAVAVSSATAACAQTCSVPLCLKWRIRYSNGLPVARICKKTAEQPLQQ